MNEHYFKARLSRNLTRLCGLFLSDSSSLPRLHDDSTTMVRPLEVLTSELQTQGQRYTERRRRRQSKAKAPATWPKGALASVPRF